MSENISVDFIEVNLFDNVFLRIRSKTVIALHYADDKVVVDNTASNFNFCLDGSLNYAARNNLQNFLKIIKLIDFKTDLKTQEIIFAIATCNSTVYKAVVKELKSKD